MATRIRVIHETAVFAIIWRNLSAPTAPPRTMDARRARTRADATRDANLHAMLLHDRTTRARATTTTDRRRRTVSYTHLTLPTKA